MILLVPFVNIYTREQTHDMSSFGLVRAQWPSLLAQKLHLSVALQAPFKLAMNPSLSKGPRILQSPPFCPCSHHLFWWATHANAWLTRCLPTSQESLSSGSLPLLRETQRWLRGGGRSPARAGTTSNIDAFFQGRSRALLKYSFSLEYQT